MQPALDDPGAASPSTRRTLGRIAFYSHLWLGVLTTVALIAISITGILLNHKRGLGLMPDVPHEPRGPFAAALPPERLALAALAAAPPQARGAWQPGDPVDLALFDRMDVRPRDGFREGAAPRQGLDGDDRGPEHRPGAAHRSRGDVFRCARSRVTISSKASRLPMTHFLAGAPRITL